MDAVNALCFLVMRLTPAQRSLLHRVSLGVVGRVDAVWSREDAGVLVGLARLDLLTLRYAAGGAAYGVSALGENVLDVLTDTQEVS